MLHSSGTSEKCSNGKSSQTSRKKRRAATFFKRVLFLPRALCIRLILFYQRRISRHTCLYEPTCSEYTKRCIHNLGAVAGIVLGIWRILRCNPLSKGGYDPAPENRFKRRWLV